jgi:hypothetical protein
MNDETPASPFIVHRSYFIVDDVASRISRNPIEYHTIEQ